MEANELRIGNVVKVSASGEIIKVCKYLHQLQNLYFALTNKELQWQ